MTNASEAFAHAQSAHDKIDAHEDLCAERYAHIQTTIGNVTKTVDTILKVLAWGGTTIFGLIVLCLGFLAARAINVNDSEVDRLRAELQQVKAEAPAEK